MYKLNLTKKQCEITLSNESHKIIWDGRAYIIKERAMRKNKEGVMEVVYDTKFYYSNLKSVIKELAMMKLLTNKESITLAELINQIDESEKEIINNLREVLEKTVSREPEIDS